MNTVIPAEMMHGAVQSVVYFFTLIGIMLSVALGARA